MAKRKSFPPIEYAVSVLPGLEEVAGDEIQARLRGARIIKRQRGWVVLGYPGKPDDLFALRTVEDVFVVLFHTGKLPSFRKGALPLLARMARGSRYWDQALGLFYRLNRRVRRVTFRVIAQMTGKLGFRRQEARDAVLGGVQERWGRRWKAVADDAHIELWVPIINQWALIAIRLSDRTMRHRTYKEAHRPASLRPTLAAAMVFLSDPAPKDRFCDPMCGAGTILAERARHGSSDMLLGGDMDGEALHAAAANLSGTVGCTLYEWDAARLPLQANSLDVVVSNLPFGEKIGSHEQNQVLYDRFFKQLLRVLCPGGRAVLLTAEKELMRRMLQAYPQFVCKQQVLVGVLGKAARIYILHRR